MVKKINYDDPSVKMEFKLHTESDLTIENEDIRKFIDMAFQLSAVSGNTIKKFEVANGLPIYEYTMTRKDDKVWYQEVRIADGDFDVACHKFDVQDFWCNKIIDVYFLLRRMSTKLLYNHKISDIKIEWT